MMTKRVGDKRGEQEVRGKRTEGRREKEGKREEYGEGKRGKEEREKEREVRRVCAIEWSSGELR